ncbi:MAG: C-GCAxxG-C-C family protein [Oscillospiraceae bacterium]|nr:C-GCAxxG-C-C family protein [Oscillospiraceae bacterium]
MTIEERAEQAVAYKHKACNCCQAVLFALKDQTGLDDAQLLAMASGFGSGMGSMEGSCGALVGAAMAAGLRLNGSGTSRAARQMSLAFKDACGAVTCRELKGVRTGRVLCACDDCVRNAVRIYGKLMGLD